jgi:translation elongation factor P/translation initiation factor 5A
MKKGECVQIDGELWSVVSSTPSDSFKDEDGRRRHTKARATLQSFRTGKTVDFVERYDAETRERYWDREERDREE